MTDLRTRIAAAIESIRIQRDGDAAFMADAVIRELGLREETVAFANGPLNGFKGGRSSLINPLAQPPPTSRCERGIGMPAHSREARVDVMTAG